jgi:hypothetical protein
MNIDAGYIRVLTPLNSHQDNVKPQASATQDLSPTVVVKGSAQVSADLDNNNNKEDTNGAAGDKVSLSEEAKEKQAEEANASGAQGGSPADIVIEKLKERIEQVKKQLENIAGKEGFEEQEKMLQDELAILNAALMEAMNEKLQAMQAG